MKCNEFVDWELVATPDKIPITNAQGELQYRCTLCRDGRARIISNIPKHVKQDIHQRLLREELEQLRSRPETSHLPAAVDDMDLVDDGLRNLLHSLVVTGTTLESESEPSLPRSPAPLAPASMIDWNLFEATEDTYLSSPSMDQQGVALIAQELIDRLNSQDDEIGSEDEDEERSDGNNEQEVVAEPTITGKLKLLC